MRACTEREAAILEADAAADRAAERAEDEQLRDAWFEYLTQEGSEAAPDGDADDAHRPKLRIRAARRFWLGGRGDLAAEPGTRAPPIRKRRGTDPSARGATPSILAKLDGWRRKHAG